MAQPTDWIQWQTINGDPITVGDVTVTPQSQSLTVRWPFGGFVWNRPVAVLVERGGQTERIPIVDTTRMVQLGVLGFGLACAAMAFISLSRQRRDSHG
ncbi:MAG: hypothetical protein IT330_14180 [Anaerolineae bacterium]|nr:hypothetical protein [Anaerolineae bacterium]